MHKSLAALCLFLSLTTFANENAQKAATAYSQRDFTEVGIQNAEQAIALYDLAINEEVDATLKMTYKSQQASAYYFLGTALSEKEAKMAAHVSAMNLCDSIMTDYGVDSSKAHELSQTAVDALVATLDETSQDLLAEAMYTKGISLAQWGNLKGFLEALDRLPEVLGLMERIEMLGKESIHEYGPYRTIGRVNFVLPESLGGDLDLSEDYLKRATIATLVEGERYSVNAYNSLYFAEVLHKRKKEDQAKKVLQSLLDADPSTLKEGSEPENKQALQRALELSEEWK